MRLAWLIFALFSAELIFYGFTSSQYPQDPYVVLGLKRHASPRDIKQAYKRLVKEWHPDKNDSPEASDKFMAIAQAYELLSDPVRKERFDNYGAYDTQPSYNDHHGHGFDDIFNYAFGGGGYGGSRGHSSSFEKYRITYRMYANSLLEKSHTQPFIIYAYSTYCHVCFVLEPIWKESVADLESLGYGIGTINYLTDGNLFEKLRISYLPAICVLVEGRIIHLRGPMNTLSAKAIRLFARDAIPSTFLLKLNNYNALRRFLDLWESTNKPSILIIGAKEEPRLRYSLLAMKFSHFARFAYVNVNSAESDVREMKVALGIQCVDCENIFIFKENPEVGPVAKMTVDKRQFSNDEMSALINKHKLLRLPRISSMPLFDDLCPVSSRSLKHICVILPIVSGAEDAPFVQSLRKFVEAYGEQMAKERVHIATLFLDYQRDFMAEFKEVNAPSEPKANKRHVLVIWRYEYVTAKYKWLPNIWTSEADSMHKSFEELKSRIYLLSRGNLMLGTAKISSLVDEYAPSWFTRISRRIVRLVETIWFHITKEELLPILSVAGTLFFIFFIGYGLNYLVNENHQNAAKAQSYEKQNFQSGPENKEWHPDDPKTPKPPKPAAKVDVIKTRMWREMEPMIHELRAETYFGLIRLLKPGCRSIIVLVDGDSKDILLPKFARYVYSLRNNKTFSFGYLMVDKNLDFFRVLLEHTLPNAEETVKAEKTEEENEANISPLKSRLKGINPKQTLGTVLVMCGWKLYFSMYHPMHKASRTKNGVGLESSDNESSSDMEDNEAGSSAGLIKNGQKKRMLKKDLNVENVLNEFPSFLDRLLEGSIRRYYIPEWPENLK